MTQQYKNPAGGTASTIGPQSVTHYQLKKAIITARQLQFFGQLASVENMPKHMGKKMKVFEYIPLLDDRNVNDQGIDAAGVTIDNTKVTINFGSVLAKTFAVEADATAAAAAVNAVQGGFGVKTGSSNPWTVTLGNQYLKNATPAQAVTIATSFPGISTMVNSGNLYGSSRDIGTISNKLPLLTENGGRVNRVGFTRIEREGSLIKLGFFHEYTQESLDFDSDDELFSHLSTEMLNGAVEISEALLQKDLILSAGVIAWAGAATTNGTVTGEGGTPSVVDYSDLQRLGITLDDNRTPKQTKVITGSRLIDTRTLQSGRIMYVGSELIPMLEAMKDLHNQPAYIPVHKYADAGSAILGEQGSIGAWRFVVVPEMMYWDGAGAPATGSNLGYRVGAGNRYNVYPMLAVGADSFSTIGFQTDGKTVKFTILVRKPGNETADRTDPYGELGFSSIKWYYGFIAKRPERIARLMTVAPQ